MNNYCHWKGPRPVGTTQKTPFPLSSDSKASLSSDFGTNSNSCASKSKRLSTASSIRKSSQLGTSRITYWNHQLDSLHQNLANGNCPWLGDAKRKVRLLSVSPQSCSPFLTSLQTFCLTSRAYLNTQKYGMFGSLIELRRWESLTPMVGPPLPNRSKDRDHTKCGLLVLQAGGWVEDW